MLMIYLEVEWFNLVSKQRQYFTHNAYEYLIETHKSIYFDFNFYVLFNNVQAYDSVNQNPGLVTPFTIF